MVYIKFIFALPFLLFTLNLMGFEAMHEKTPVGELKILQLPARTALEANAGQSYFSENNGLFRTLFRYISKHDLSMTTPVEADIEPGKMRFFVGGKDASLQKNRQLMKLGPKILTVKTHTTRGENKRVL